MHVLIAEKPSVAASFAAALKEVTLSNGEILETKHLTLPKYDRLIKEARKDGFFRGKNHLITYAFGHLFTLKEPDEVNPALKSWKMESLPFHIDNIPLKLSGGPTFAVKKNQYETIRKLFQDAAVDDILVATDAGREGEHIFRTIYQMSNSHKPFERIWLKDMTEDGILRAYSQRKPGIKYEGLAEAARCRAESDYLVGMNMTRAMTVKFGGFKNVLSIGRVQTPTLAILVGREKEIERFIPEDFYTIKGTFQHPNGEYEALWFRDKDDRFKERKAAETVLQRVKGQPGTITEVTVKREVERNPLLYDLTELQRTANKLMGFSASKTLDVAQKLYDEHKLITYPRTSSRYLATGTGKTVGAVLKNLRTAFASIVSECLEHQFKFAAYMINDSKTGDHEAIIPTQKTPDLNKLSPDEKAIYELIVKRFVSAFYPPAVWENSTIVTTVADETFIAKGKVLKEGGWRLVEGIPNSTLLPVTAELDAVANKQILLEKKKTQPPKRLTDADLLSAMEHAGRFVEEEELKDMLKEAGIGTPATRSTIIEELIKRGYVKREKKVLVPTQEKGVALMDILPIELLKSPEMTAIWEKKLAEVEKGTFSRASFMREMREAIATMVAQVRGHAAAKLASAEPGRSEAAGPGKGARAASGRDSAAKETLIADALREVGVCPACGGAILDHPKGYGCANFNNGCTFAIWKNTLQKFAKKSITVTEAKQLLAKGITNKKVRLHSKSKNKDFEAYITIDKGKVGLKFD